MQPTTPGQTWSADTYARNARFVADLAVPVVDLLAPRPGERVLDLGCGDGALTVRLVEASAEVVGADSAPDLVEAARALGLDARLVDGHALPFEAEFDAVFSNAALHWMKDDPDAVIAGVRRALKPGGRFVGEMGGHANIASIIVALLAVLERRGIDGRPFIPWYFPTAEEYRGKLEAAGFEVVSIAIVPRPTPLATGMAGWLETFGGAFLQAVSDAERPAVIAETVRLLEPALMDRQGRWTADYVRLRFQAVLPG